MAVPLDRINVYTVLEAFVTTWVPARLGVPTCITIPNRGNTVHLWDVGGGAWCREQGVQHITTHRPMAWWRGFTITVS